jgi:glycerol uptake facilitator-like aquaporin
VTGLASVVSSWRTIIWHSALEFLLTFVLLFGMVTIVRWVIGPSAVARALPHIHLQLLIVGIAVGLLITGLILSPPGRASGGHMNPAISLAMWRFGVFPAVGLLPYTAAQLVGSVLGALAAGAVWGSAAARPRCPTPYSSEPPAGRLASCSARRRLACSSSCSLSGSA